MHNEHIPCHCLVQIPLSSSMRKYVVSFKNTNILSVACVRECMYECVRAGVYINIYKYIYGLLHMMLLLSEEYKRVNKKKTLLFFSVGFYTYRKR